MTNARRRLIISGGQCRVGAAGTRISSRALSRQIRTAQASTASAANAMPIHIVRCGVHVMVTVTGDVEPGNRQPLNPPEI